MERIMVFSKICIICSNEFFTVRSNTLYCSKKCRNRVRYLPQQIVNSLVKRNAQFTMKANKFTASIQGRTIETLPADIQLCEAKARDEARRRGIKVSSIVDDNLDYINTTDPALGDSTGFGIKPDNITEQE